MKWRTLLPLLGMGLSFSICTAAPQTAHPTQASPASTSQRAQWTEADRKALLAKAHQGDRKSQFWLGVAYEQGYFGKADFQEAVKWFKRAAAQGDQDAQDSLGQLYEDGEGVKQNYTLAAQWYRRAAEHVSNLGGASQGRNNLGLLYMDGRGVRQDYVQAYMWFRLAGVDDNLSQAKTQMTSAQVLQAERMATEWKSKHPER